MSRILLSCQSLFLAGVCLTATNISFAETIDVNVTVSGWVKYNGDTNGLNGSATNFFTGRQVAGEPNYSNYFVFDLSGVNGEITSASLKLENPDNGFYSFDNDYFGTSNCCTYSVTSLTDGGITPSDLLPENWSYPYTGTAVWSMVNNGTPVSYGNIHVDESSNGTTVEIVLNQIAIDDINASIEQSSGNNLFAIGGNLEAANARIAYAFANTSNNLFSRTLTLGTNTPDPLNFSNVYDAALGAQIISDTITITGIDVGVDISISGGEYSLNGAPFTSVVGTAVTGDTLQLRTTSSTNYNSTTDVVVSIGGGVGTWSVTTLTDTVPDTFNFTDQSGVATNVQVTSNAIVITGLSASSPISITGGEYNINGGAYTSINGFVNNNDAVMLRTTSSSIRLTASDTVLTIGGVSDAFTIMTGLEDTTPNPFSYYDRTGAQLNTVYNSTNSIQVSGITADAPISISGGEYSIDGGAWTSAQGTVSNLSRVLLRQTSASAHSTTVDTVLTIGDVSSTFSITTKVFIPDTAPNQFSFYDRTGTQLNRLYNSTNSIQVSGINTDAPISVTGGEYSIDGGAWTSAPGTVSLFSRVLLRQTSADTGSTQTDTVLTIGGVSATFSTTTKATPAVDTTPNQFSYYDRVNAQLSRLYNSTNSIQVSGINADAPISVTGGEYSIDGGAWTSAPGLVNTFTRVLLRQTSASTNNTQTDTVLTIGGVSATFSITTKP